MKSIKYILLVVVLSSILIAAVPIKFKRYKKEVILECVNDNAKKEDIVKSVIIFKNRLNTSGLDYKLKLKNDNTISISFKTETDYQQAESLIFSRANFGFYLAFENKAGLDIIFQDESLLDIYKSKIFTSESYGQSVIFVSDENKHAVEDIIKNSILKNSELSTLDIAWSKTKSENGMWELFLLEKSNYIDGSFIKKSFAQIDKITNYSAVMIEFSEEGAKLWSNLTGENINKNVSIVVDGEVYSSPRIMDRISGGKAMISGNFSENQAKDLAALIQYGELPLEFRIKE
jgi:preprotein translocase subunit SecD